MTGNPVWTGSALDPPLDRPYPGAPLGEVWRRFWKKGVTFSGRASRSEYWKFTLLQTGIMIGLYAGMLMALAVTDGSEAEAGFALFLVVVVLLWVLATLVPSLALCIRRLHDAGYSGACYLLSFIPFVGSLILVILLAQASSPSGARFDERPMAGLGYPGAVPSPQPPYPAPYEPSTEPAWSLPQSAPVEPGDPWATRMAAPPPTTAYWSVALPDGRRFGLEHPVILGRDPSADYRYPDAVLVVVGDGEFSVSKTHAVVSMLDGQPSVTDVYSTNGTRLILPTGQAISLPTGQPQPATEAVRICLGDYEIQLVETGPSAGVWR